MSNFYCILFEWFNVYSMKGVKFIFSLMLLLALASCGQDKYTWGISRTSVRHQQGAPSAEEPSVLIYDAGLAGLPASKGYMFAGEKLAAVSYIQHYPDTIAVPLAAVAFSKLSDSISSKKGQYVELSLEDGYKIQRIWLGKKTNINLFLFNESVMLTYESKKLAAALKSSMNRPDSTSQGQQ